MITAARSFGGARKLNVGTGDEKRIHPTLARWYSINTTAAGGAVKLPHATDELDGYFVGPRFMYVANIGATHDVVLENSEGDALATIEPDQVAIVHLASKADSGEWWIVVRDLD